MSQLTIYCDNAPYDTEFYTTDGDEISSALHQVGVRFERWSTEADVRPGDAEDKILDAYKESIEKIKKEKGYQTADVVSLNADHPDKAAFRQKFLSEHTHSEDEVRFFVAGSGLFCLHIDDKVYAVLCEKGDLISVPDGTTHWFDMGENPSFSCIRIFSNPEGWVAKFTSSDIADQIPNMDTYQ